MGDRHLWSRICIVTLAVVATGSGPATARASVPQAPATARQASADGALPAGKAQPRKHTVRVPVDPQQIDIDDGDTVFIHWSPTDREDVRILAIDCPETQHLPHNIPFAQPFGEEARGFASGVFATATTIELLRAPTLDPYGRTLGYLFVNGKNYSVMIVAARLAEESVTHYGDNGFPQEAAAVLKAARAAGPLPFESPAAYRLRMRGVSDWMKAHGAYPPTQ
jgi:endonuclease YncB( thermonuclease family)